MKITTGKKAPAFALPDQEGKTHTLAQYRGQFGLVYFYPKDDTPGCTIEACQFRDNFPKFGKLNAVVLGISTDPVKKHAKFVEKYELPFTLLADEEKKVVEMYGVWGTKKFMGREYMGTARTSFLVDPEGTVVKIYENVKPAKHAEEVIEDIKQLN